MIPSFVSDKSFISLYESPKSEFSGCGAKFESPFTYKIVWSLSVGSTAFILNVFYKQVNFKLNLQSMTR